MNYSHLSNITWVVMLGKVKPNKQRQRWKCIDQPQGTWPVWSHSVEARTLFQSYIKQDHQRAFRASALILILIQWVLLKKPEKRQNAGDVVEGSGSAVEKHMKTAVEVESKNRVQLQQMTAADQELQWMTSAGDNISGGDNGNGNKQWHRAELQWKQSWAAKGRKLWDHRKQHQHQKGGISRCWEYSHLNSTCRDFLLWSEVDGIEALTPLRLRAFLQIFFPSPHWHPCESVEYYVHLCMGTDIDLCMESEQINTLYFSVISFFYSPR